MNILITGASGLVGSSLVEHLFSHGHSIFSLQRNTQEHGRFWNLERLDAAVTRQSFDAVIHLAGENIAAGRWTKEKKERILDSRVRGTQQLARYCAGLQKKPEIFISASAIGFYGDRGDCIVDEKSASGTHFLAHVCREWEAAAAPARDAGIRVVHGRIGMVLSGKGGALSKMLPSFKFGFGGVVGSGTQYISWVGIKDLAAMFLFLLETPVISGPVNLVAPEPVTNSRFTKTLATLMKRRAILRMPAWAARAVFGQMADELLLASTRVMPRVLRAQGYHFQSPELEPTLAACLNQE